MPKASVGMQRLLARLRPTLTDNASSSTPGPRPVRAIRRLRVRSGRAGTNARLASAQLARAATMPVRRRLGDRVGPESGLPLVVVLILVVASLASWLPGLPARGAVPGAGGAVAGAVGGPRGDGSAPRVALGGARSEPDRESPASGAATTGAVAAESAAERDRRLALLLGEAPPTPVPSTATGPFLADGTILKPVAVRTVVPDGKALLKRHTVRAGDTLASVGRQFGVSAETVWWANDLDSTTLVPGTELIVPPVDGLVVTVRDGDSLETLAARHRVGAEAILRANRLDDPVLVAGQTLILPGAVGEPLPTPSPTPTPTPTRAPAPARTAAPAAHDEGAGTSGDERNSGDSGGDVGNEAPAGPATYGGGGMAWPVVGGNNYVSQPFQGDHFGLDIAATYGSVVQAAAGGTVTFAGWKDNGGGYQVWISHGSGLFTTYNHMASVSVGQGQAVGAGQAVGLVGESGLATGSHLHFEVWQGPIWDGGQRADPMGYL